RIGKITMGHDVVVGDATFIDIDTVIGDGGQLGHSSSLHAGQVIPAGQVWHGSLAAAGPGDYRLDGARSCGSFRRAVFAISELLSVVLGLPVLIVAALSASTRYPWLAEVLNLDEPNASRGDVFSDQ